MVKKVNYTFVNPLPLASNLFETQHTADFILFGCKTWCVTLQTEFRMRRKVLCNGVLGGMIGPEKE